MNNIKHILCISLLFVGYSIHGMDTSSSAKATIKKEIENRYNELLIDFNNEVNEASLGIEDPEQLRAFLDLAYSPETQQKLRRQAEADVAASRLVKDSLERSKKQHTSPEKPKFKKTLPSSRTSTRRKGQAENTPTINRPLNFD